MTPPPFLTRWLRPAPQSASDAARELNRARRAKDRARYVEFHNEMAARFGRPPVIMKDNHHG